LQGDGPSLEHDQATTAAAAASGPIVLAATAAHATGVDRATHYDGGAGTEDQSTAPLASNTPLRIQRVVHAIAQTASATGASTVKCYRLGSTSQATGIVGTVLPVPTNPTRRAKAAAAAAAAALLVAGGWTAWFASVAGQVALVGTATSADISCREAAQVHVACNVHRAP
jgi:hypothetical protein